MRCFALLSASVAALIAFSAAPAAATNVAITFDFSATTISALGGQINIPPDGAIMSASAVVTAPVSQVCRESRASAAGSSFPSARARSGGRPQADGEVLSCRGGRLRYPSRGCREHTHAVRSLPVPEADVSVALDPKARFPRYPLP